MRKLLSLLLLLTVSSTCYAKSYIDEQLKEVENNLKYSTVQIHESNYKFKDLDFTIKTPKDLKDPQIIKLTQFSKISEEDYAKKLTQDEKTYSSKIEPLFNKKSDRQDQAVGVDYYRVYRVAERIIRANNLDYMNWRIAVRKTKSFNATTSDGNYVEIHTGLYDTLYQNEDAFAYVIAHEMAHQILGHSRRSQDLEIELKNLKSNYKKDSTYRVIRTKNIFKELRKMEYMADTEGLTLLVKAGYSPYKALEALNFMVATDSTKERVFFNHRTHPHSIDRFKSFNENINVIDPNWIEAGRENIYNSEVLKCKKSTDRVSFVINKSTNAKNFYHVETLEERLTRIAYTNYLRTDMENSIKYFDMLIEEDKNNYIPHLYKSYANEYLYKTTKKDKFLKRAIKDAEKASELEPNNEFVKEQIEQTSKL